MKSSEICTDDRRRQDIRDQADAGRHDWNGIDYVEVEDDQVTLTVYFLRKAPRRIKLAQVRIEGGRRITGIQVRTIRVCRQNDQELDDCLQVTVDKPGDFSTYRLCLVELDDQGRPTDRPMQGFDPRYACAEFSFRANCPSDLDCQAGPPCPPAPLDEPEISYLAKDYASFRQILFDRLALIMPDWQERHVPDLGVTLVELLAYAGDQLSYYQDAVATEAYLDTARQRISVRRHARLVDYAMHEGCNARALVCIDASDDVADPPLDWREVSFITGHADALALGQGLIAPADLRNIPADQYEVFEPMVKQPIRIYHAHNRITFYNWGDRDCCLPRGSTSATLYDGPPRDQGDSPPATPPDDEPNDSEQQDPAQYTRGKKRPPAQQRPPEKDPPEKDPPPAPIERVLNLRVGDFLIFEEIVSPTTGSPNDADPRRRHAVRLTRVEPGEDQLYDPPIPIVEIAWSREDALPFPLCISATGPAPECTYLDPVSVARGNVVLVDHGRTTGRLNPDEPDQEPLGEVPGEQIPAHCEDTGCPEEIATTPGWFRPRLRKAPLTFGQPLPRGGSAARLMQQDPRKALPQIALTSYPPSPLLALPTPDGARARVALPLAGGGAGAPWSARPDLLGSGPDDYDYVAEIDNDGYAHLRFGDGGLGRAPEAGATFAASYRVGNGPAGNVGTDSITHIVLDGATLGGVALTPRNPLPATGGVSPEPLAEVKLFAPYAFRAEIERAITADDYARLAMERFPGRVQRAAATLRWTGSWTEALVAIDPVGEPSADDELLREIAAYLYRYRRIGHDLLVARAVYVPLDIALTVCVKPGYLRGHVKAALLDLLGSRALPGGGLGFFHPDNLTFGEGVAVSKLVGLAQAVPGVQNVIVTRLQRFGEGDNGELASGILPLGPLEVARLDNDPDFLENGILKLEMAGGR